MAGLSSFARKIFGTPNDRRVKGYQPRVDAINALEPEMKALSDEELAKRGLRREDIPRHVFRDLFYV